MNLKKQKILIAISSGLGFLFTTQLVLYCAYNAEKFPLLSKGLVGASLSLYGLLILLAWFSAGPILGSVFVILASLITLFISALTGVYVYNLQIAFFLSVGLVSYIFFKKIKDLARQNEVRVEEIQELINTLKASFQREKSVTDSLKKRFHRYHALKNITEHLSSLVSLEDTASYVAENAFKVIGKSDVALLFLVDEERQELALRATEQKGEAISIKSKKGDIFDNWVLKQRKPLLVQDVKKDFRFSFDEAEWQERPFVSVISAPLIVEGKVLGILRLDSIQAENYTPDDLRVLSIISDLAAVAIKNCLLYRRTEELAIKDGLTGLYVHRYFKTRLDEELIRTQRTRGRLSLLMIDIDNFKDYNDRFGHSAGDIVLREVAAILKGLATPGDLAARYGGEEFTLALPGTDKAKALDIAERIRNSIETRAFILRRHASKVTVSVGVSTFPEDAATKEELLRNADEYLYVAKREGRNKVCAA